MKNTLIILVAIFLIACKSDNNNSNKIVEKELVKSPNFNSDSAFKFVESQVKFGPRVPGTNPHKLCKEFIIEKCKSYKANVVPQNTKIKIYNGKEYDVTNIIASYNTESKARILLSAHWDTRPFADEDTKDKEKPILGANDGASGVGILLEIARLLSLDSTKIGVDLIFWDAEDMGNPQVENSYCLGSQFWGKNPHISNYKAMFGVNLDMVGAKGAVFPIEGISSEWAKPIVDKVWKYASQLGYGAYFINQITDPITDDHLYVNTLRNIPTIDIIHKDIEKNKFFEHWHTHGDNMDVIDPQTLKAVGQTLIQLIYQEQSELL